MRDPTTLTAVALAFVGRCCLSGYFLRFVKVRFKVRIIRGIKRESLYSIRITGTPPCCDIQAETGNFLALQAG